jgi:hypothetical protein
MTYGTVASRELQKPYLMVSAGHPVFQTQIQAELWACMQEPNQVPVGIFASWERDTVACDHLFEEDALKPVGRLMFETLAVALKCFAPEKVVVK